MGIWHSMCHALPFSGVKLFFTEAPLSLKGWWENTMIHAKITLCTWALALKVHFVVLND